MKVIADLHTHSIASDHAFSTLLENVFHAKKMGLEVIALTDHAPGIVDSPHMWHFTNMRNSVPKYIEGIRVLTGAELSVMDFNGSVDLPEEILKRQEIAIASCHPVLKPGTKDDHTNMWINIAKNKDIDIIGHSGNPDYEFYLEPAVKAFKDYGKVVEINAHSPVARPGSENICREIAILCKKYRVPVVTNSDAHFCASVGEVSWAINLLKSIDYPEELILSLDRKRLFDHFNLED